MNHHNNFLIDTKNFLGRRQFKLRGETNGKAGPWFTPFFVSENQLRKIVKETKWKIGKIYRNKVGDRFSVVLEKK